MIDEFLNKLGINYEKLNEEEKRTLLNWLESISQAKISLEDVKVYVREMADNVSKELAEYEVPRKKDIFLKARLRNYLLLLDFLTAPEKAQKSLERYLKAKVGY